MKKKVHKLNAALMAHAEKSSAARRSMKKL